LPQNINDILQHKPPHPGAFIRRVYLESNNVRAVDVASNLNVSTSVFSRLINEKVSVSPIIALKLSKVLGRSPESWLEMQRNFDLRKARSKNPN
jgi:antitoxin HigA-1